MTKLRNIHFTDITIFILLNRIFLFKNLIEYIISYQLVKKIQNCLEIIIFCIWKQKLCEILVICVKP